MGDTPERREPGLVGRRLTAVRGFARYLQTIDPAAELPPRAVLPVGTGRRRPTPYIYSDAEIAALMTAAGGWLPRLSAATMQTLIGLLAVTGMRIGEAIRLDRADLDLEHRRLVIHNSKFGKSRQLPLHPSTAQALHAYLRRRDRAAPRCRDAGAVDHRDRQAASSATTSSASSANSADKPGSHRDRDHDRRESTTSATPLPCARCSTATATEATPSPVSHSS